MSEMALTKFLLPNVLGRINKKALLHRTFLHLCASKLSSKSDDGNKVNSPHLEKPPELHQSKDAAFILKEDFKNIFRNKPLNLLPIPRETGYCIIGGGINGASVAYWLKRLTGNEHHVTVIERDPTYSQAATMLSVGGIRTQFSLPENVKMSLFSAEFFRNLTQNLGLPSDDGDIDIQFQPQGYLFLATADGVDQLRENFAVQISEGAHVELLSPEHLKQRWPWLNVDDIALGSYGTRNEGWFDPWSLLQSVRRKAIALGADFVKGEVVGFRKNWELSTLPASGGEILHDAVQYVDVKVDSGLIYPMQAHMFINCAGPWSGEVSRMIGIGDPENKVSMNRVPLPIEPRKRYVYVVHTPDGPCLDMPMIIDPSGVYVRREGIGGHYICGKSPIEDHHSDNSAIPLDYFDKDIKSIISHRVPALMDAKMKSAWAGFYDYNYFDQNVIVGKHPYYPMMFCCGSSGHGIQHGLALGYAVSEFLHYGHFMNMDLSRFSFERVLEGNPYAEKNIV